MDIYEPENDTMEDRPVIIFAIQEHFFCSKEAQDMVELCKESAKRIYCHFNGISLGLNILSSYSGEEMFTEQSKMVVIIRYLRNIIQNLILILIKIFLG